MRCIIVDDEKPALDLLESNISRVPFLQLTGRFNNAFLALEFLQQNPVDILFVDIEMPTLTGLEMLSSMKTPVQVVVVTAYEQYAVEGFNLDVTDYLLKPVSFDRFLKACLKCQQLFLQQSGQRPSPVKDQEYIFVHVDYAQVKINFKDIIYIESMRDYIKIVLKSDKPVVSRMSLKSIEAKLSPDDFIRIHKSFIVSASSILSIRKGIVVLQGHELPLSENYREAAAKRLGIIN